jgi:hypothetical protein
MVVEKTKYEESRKTCADPKLFQKGFDEIDFFPMIFSSNPF